MSRWVFTDFDQFADTISGLNGRYIPTASSQSDWWIDLRRISRLKVQRLQVGAPSAFAGDGENDELTIGIPTTNPNAISIDGQAMPNDSFILIRHGHPLTYSAQAPTRWAGLTVPIHFGADRRFLDADQLSLLPTTTRVAANRSALRRVSLLVGWLSTDYDAINVIDPAALKAAEEELLIAAAELLSTSASRTNSALRGSRLRRERILARCLEFLRENEARPILVADLCAAARTNARTLRSVFVEYFGVGPGRFLEVRQLYEIRNQLLAPQLPGETVASIAARSGVWNFDLFARNYHAVYAESPTDTLHAGRRYVRPVTGAREVDSLRSWIAYATRRFGLETR
jgi:AraC family ethanolamine operon transcriptional activator